MRWSDYYLYTVREAPADAEVASHQLMVRAGMIRKVAAGIYSYLPLGWRTIRKMEAIVRREMERAGSSELLMPAIHPAQLWRETGRWDVYGHLLLRMKDRQQRDFCFGPTHEEVITDIVRKDINSYRQLPRNLFQIQTKFRDEIRPRFGLMRGREFVMKDAYSFHSSQDSLTEVYEAMRDAYCRIVEACGLEYTMVEADSGSIGGASSHEFMVLAVTGEDSVVRCSACGYGANVEKAAVGELPGVTETERREAQRVSTPDKTTVEDVAAFLDRSVTQFVKTLIYETEKEFVAVFVRGDREVNEVKLKNLLDAQQLRLAREDDVVRETGAPVGFAGPIGLSDEIRKIADRRVAELVNFACGANAVDEHWVDANWGVDADLPEVADLLLAQAGDPCPRCDGVFELYRGIEVGHIFDLGTKYSSSMGCTYLDENGKAQEMIMGCYGFGVTRTVAAAIEQNHDENGIIWPLPLAPFEAVVIGLGNNDEQVSAAADAIYNALHVAGVDVLYDDRGERPGVKFKDADLIGIPVRIVIGAKSLAEGSVEISQRRDGERHLVAKDDAVEAVQKLLAEQTG